MGAITCIMCGLAVRNLSPKIVDKVDQLQDTINVKLYLRIYSYHLKARKILHLMSPQYFLNSCVSFQRLDQEFG